MARPPESTRTSLRQRLAARARERWPQLAGITVRWHGEFAYVGGQLPNGTTLPLMRLRYTGSASTWASPSTVPATQRWQQVHDLLSKGTGLLECSRHLQLSLNTVKRYARASQPERLARVPQYRAALVDPYRDHLRARRADDPAVPVARLLREIRDLGYQGSANLLVR